jgi:hypothetical protein
LIVVGLASMLLLLRSALGLNCLGLRNGNFKEVVIVGSAFSACILAVGAIVATIIGQLWLGSSSKVSFRSQNTSLGPTRIYLPIVCIAP